MTAAPQKPWRRLSMGLRTLLSRRPQGFFIPYRHAGDGAVQGRDAYPELGAWLAAHEDDFTDLLAAMRALAPAFQAIPGDGPPPGARWGQAWFPPLDAAALYTLIRARQPERIVEVGSGHSTRFAARAIADAGHGTRLTCIDPAPRAALDGLKIEWRRGTLQSVGLAPFDDLAPGDMLLIDSSHISMPGTDVDLLFGRVLPRLCSGVLVQIHDIVLPDGYPADWAWRAYNEQPAVAALVAGGGWRPVWSSHYVATRMAAELADHPVAALPRAAEARDTALWLTKTGPPLVAP